MNYKVVCMVLFKLAFGIAILALWNCVHLGYYDKKALLVMPIFFLTLFNWLIQYLDRKYDIFHTYTVELQEGGEIDTRKCKDLNLEDGRDYKQLEALLREMDNLVTLKVKISDGTPGRWLQKLPKTLEKLTIEGLKEPLERWRPLGGLPCLQSLSLRDCSGVTDSTLDCLPYMAPFLTELFIDDCHGVTAGGLHHIEGLKLERLTLHGMPAGVFTEAGQDSPEGNGQCLQKLPLSLNQLCISEYGYPTPALKPGRSKTTADDSSDDFQADPENPATGMMSVQSGIPATEDGDSHHSAEGNSSRAGPEAPLEPERVVPDAKGLAVSIRHVTYSTLACLTGLETRVEDLIIADCPDMTASGMLLVGKLTKLERLTLLGMPDSVFTDAGQDTAQWLNNLQLSLKKLYIIGLEALLEPETLAFDGKGLAVSLRHVTDSTLDHLTVLGPRLDQLLITHCPLVTTSGLLHVGRLTKLRRLIFVVPAVLNTNAEQDIPENTWRWLQKLPQSLQILDITGMKVPLEQWLPQEGLPHLKRLFLHDCSGVIDSTLACLPVLAPELQSLHIDDYPRVTAEGLLHFGSLKRLERLTLRGGSADVITDRMLDSLCSCSELKKLQLVDKHWTRETGISAAAVCRLVVACRKLDWLALDFPTAISQDVEHALHRTSLGSNSKGEPRTIPLGLPRSVYSLLKLKRLPSGTRIFVRKWTWKEPQ